MELMFPPSAWVIPDQRHCLAPLAAGGGREDTTSAGDDYEAVWVGDKVKLLLS